ncbi:MAG TPA: hypothetical protein VHB70_03915 [Parafilimonas sp.]|nr:hypothetical protein [Parafilimonas sp.]
MRPQYLYIAADGPRNNNVMDKQLCEEARKNIINNIDWKCEVKQLFQESNLGCGLAPATGITWFFEHVDEGIILEDDLIPNKSFFLFCKAMLERYRNDYRVMHISGDCFIPFSIAESYYFTNYTHVWGWATWKRAWKLFNMDMLDWNLKNKDLFLNKTLNHYHAEIYWKQIFDKISHVGYKDVWDFQWTYACWCNNALAISPGTNLVTNFGFRSDATHTFSLRSPLAKIPTYEINIKNLIHPLHVTVNQKAEAYVRDKIYLRKKTSVLETMYRFLKYN